VEAITVSDYNPGLPEEPQTALIAETFGLPSGHSFDPCPFDPLYSEPLDWPASKTVRDLYPGLDHHDIDPSKD